jgi:hypothetical protein
MEKVFFHPERVKIDSIPVFTNYYQYQSINYFLRVAEYLEPQLIKDLEDLIPLYTETEKTHNKGEIDRYGFIDDWKILEQANAKVNQHLLNLREAIINWAKKYHLIDDGMLNKTYLEIATWAIPDKRDHPNTVEEWKEFCNEIGSEVPRDFLNWSITNAMYFEDEREDVEKVKNKDDIFSEDRFPFLFTPNFDNLHGNKGFIERVDEASDYENIRLSNELDIYHTLKGEEEKIGKFLRCEAWDPRNDTWTEFEKMLDAAYKKYKELYRSRTEAYMERLGYIEGKEKRNLEHFEWLVRYQIQEWEIRNIADHYSKKNKVIGEDTIQKALKNTAVSVGLKLRKS